MSVKKNINGIRPRKKTTVHEERVPIHTTKKVTTREELPVDKQQKKSPKKRVVKSTPSFRFKKPSRIKKRLISLGLFLILVFIVLSHFDKTVVTITPHSEMREIDSQVTTKRNPSINELGFDIIAIQNSKDFVILGAGTRQVEEKAHGTIRVFNDYSTAPQRLVEETRFESVDGKIYKIPKGDGVIIPGKQGDKPGSVDVVVYAEKSGEEYNIGLTDFTVPGFKELGLDKKYESIYALSTEEFTGGGSHVEPIVTDDQRNQSVKIAQDNLALDLQDQLEREKTEDFVVVDGSVRIDLHEIKHKSVKKNEHTYEQSGTIYAVIVRKQEVEKYLVTTEIDPKDGQQVVTEPFENLTLSYSGGEIDYEHIQSLPVVLKVNPIFVWKTDQDLLRQALHGIKKESANIIFAEFPSIETATVSVRPFWRKRISDELRKIKIK